MKRSLFFISVVIFCYPVNAQLKDTTPQSVPEIFPEWTLVIPGATYFYNGRITEGIIFSTIELGGITTGLVYESNLKSNSSSPYYNYPLYLGLKTLDVDKCDWLRNRLEAIRYYHPDFQYDPLSEKDLFLAPFNLKNIFTPITLAFISLAVGELWIDSRGAKQNIGKVQQMYFLNRYIDRNPALAIYGGTSLAMGWEAGVSEEYYLRNAFMPILDYKLGHTKGLIYSSLAFGAMHLTNLALASKPDIGQTFLQAGEATIAGILLGKDVQNRGYRIGPAVAAHTWYDFTLMLGSFLVNPKENVFAVNVKFKL